MAIGLTAKEMETIFETEYIATSRRRESQKEDIAIDLMTQGIPIIDAKLEAKSQVQQMATVQALLLVIQENNARIELPLKHP